MNLFGNSLKFTSVSMYRARFECLLMTVQDGYVHVSLRQVSDPSEEPGMVELCVSDTGKVVRLVQKFFRR
jgi:signal transduction histidine kinase